MRLVVGVIGHVDHGKTALVRALTGMDTDRLAEEKRRGISITLGFAHLAIPGGTIDLIDMPGHERFVRTMVSGATGMAAALLVVAANEGIKPQTREHLDIAALLGVPRVIVAVSKADLDPRAAETAEAASTLVRRLGMTVTASVVTSAATGQGLDVLRAALAAAVQDTATTPDDGFFYLPVDRAFSITGHGTVVTGTLRRGRLAVSDEAALVPGDRPLRLRGLQVNGARVAVATPGQRVAANLRDVEPAQLPRGAAICPRGLLHPSEWLSTWLQAVEDAPVLENGARLSLLVGTAELQVRLRLLDRETLQPGRSCIAQLRCAEPLAVPARERFILRRPSPAQTVAGGRVIDPAAIRLRRHDAAGYAGLAALATAEPAAILHRAVTAAGAAGMTLARASHLAGVAPARAAALLAGDPAVSVIGRSVVLRTKLEDTVRTLPGVLGGAGGALGRGRLAALLPGTGEAVLEAALGQLEASGLVRRAGGTVQLRRADREQEAAEQEAAAAAQLAALLRRGGLSPPAPAELAPTPQAQRLLNRLIREGLAVRTTDAVQKRDIVFHRDAVEAAKQMLRLPLSQPPGLLLGEIGAVLGISRKFCVPLLEHLDATRFTRRVADRRMIGVLEQARPQA